MASGASARQTHAHRVTLFAAQKVADFRNGGTVTQLGLPPDEIERSEPAIDMIAIDIFSPIHLEHTMIEAYDSQRYDNKRALEVQSELQRRFASGLEPPGRYTVGIGTGEISKIPRAKQARAIHELESWVRNQTVPALAALHGRMKFVSGSPPDTPIPATLYRAPCLPEDDGRVEFALGRGEDGEVERDARVMKALQTKLGKLEASRSTCDVALTVMVLESNDYIMSNPVLITQSIRRTMNAVALPEPDALINIETSAGDGHWIDYLVKFNDWWSERTLPPEEQQRRVDFRIG